jgi:2-phosphosulfolactate phosphatase
MDNKTPLRIDVALLPSNAQHFSLENGLAVVIDTLRFTTSAIAAIATGARWVQTCTTVAEAIAQRSHDSSLLLCGERGGTKIDGFDLGNSPREYQTTQLVDRCLLFSTTNGTIAVDVAQKAQVSQIALGALVNRTAIAQHAFEFLNTASFKTAPDQTAPDHQQTRAAVTFICAGTDGLVAGEDVLTAGAMLDALHDKLIATHEDGSSYIFSDSATIARTLWKSVISNTALGSSLTDRIVAFYHQVRGGAKLVELGFGPDLNAAAAVDSLQCVPRCHLTSEPLLRFRYS